MKKISKFLIFPLLAVTITGAWVNAIDLSYSVQRYSWEISLPHDIHDTQAQPNLIFSNTDHNNDDVTDESGYISPGSTVVTTIAPIIPSDLMNEVAEDGLLIYNGNHYEPNKIEYTLPKGTCMTKEWLPIVEFFPSNNWYSGPKKQLYKGNYLYSFGDDASWSWRVMTPFNPEVHTSSYYNEGQLNAIPNMKYSIDGGKTFHRYFHRADENIDNDVCITNFSIENTSGNFFSFFYKVNEDFSETQLTHSATITYDKMKANVDAMPVVEETISRTFSETMINDKFIIPLEWEVVEGICTEGNVHICITEKPLPPISATPDNPKIPNDKGWEIPVLSNDDYNGNPPTTNDVTIKIVGEPKISVTINDEGKVIVPPTTETWIFTFEYEICDKVHPDNCSTAPVNVDLYEKEKPTPPTPAPEPELPSAPEPEPEPELPVEPELPSAPEPVVPTTSTTGGPGGYVPNTPVTPFRPINVDDGITLYSAPTVDNQCIAPVKNIDDPKIFDYYNILKVQDTSDINRALTRSEFMKLIFNSSGIDPASIDLNFVNNFIDLGDDSELKVYVAYGLQRWIISGQTLYDNDYSQKIFRPNDTISRAEASKILAGLILENESHLPKIENITTFADILPEESLSPYIEYSYAKCLLHGKNTLNGEVIDGSNERKFMPIDAISLGETTKILYNMTHPMSIEK